MNRLFSALVLLPLFAACGTESTGQPSGTKAHPNASTWTHYTSEVVEDGHAAVIQFWVRGDEVVRQYWQDGALLYDERCEGRRLSIREMLPSRLPEKAPFNYKEVADREDVSACFAAATHDELRYLRAPESMPTGERITLSDGRAALRWIGATGHHFVVDAQTALPVRADYGSEESGGITSIAFGKFTRVPDVKPPVAPEVEWTGFQETLDIPVAEAGKALGLDQVPEGIDGLKLKRSSTFRTQNLALPSYHLVWGDDIRNVQMVSTAATLPTELLGMAHDGTEYDAQEGTRHVKIGTVGGHAALVRAALRVLRPAALEDSRVRAPVSDDPSSTLAPATAPVPATQN